MSIQYKFENKTYDDFHTLAEAFARNWEAGKEQLYEDILKGYLSPIDPGLATYCARMTKSGEDHDVAFFKVLLAIDPGFSLFAWKGRVYDSLASLGSDMLAKLRANDDSDLGLWDEILENRLLLLYPDAHYSESQREFIAAFCDSKDKPLGKDSRHELFELAYNLSGDCEYVLNGKAFATIDELVAYMRSVADHSIAEFASICKSICSLEGVMDPQFEAWLAINGKKDLLQEWKESLKHGEFE